MAQTFVVKYFKKMKVFCHFKVSHQILGDLFSNGPSGRSSGRSSGKKLFLTSLPKPIPVNEFSTSKSSDFLPREFQEANTVSTSRGLMSYYNLKFKIYNFFLQLETAKETKVDLIP